MRICWTILKGTIKATHTYAKQISLQVLLFYNVLWGLISNFDDFVSNHFGLDIERGSEVPWGRGVELYKMPFLIHIGIYLLWV